MAQINKKILIVDDSQELRKILVSALHTENITVIEAGDGEEGLEKALAERPDLILLDIVMPKIDGMAMLEKLREDAWGKDVQVIVLTNMTDAEKVNIAKHRTDDILGRQVLFTLNRDGSASAS